MARENLKAEGFIMKNDEVQKKSYVAPAMKEVELQHRESLLNCSNPNGCYDDEAN